VPEVVRPAPERVEYAAPGLRNAPVAPPQSGTVQWRGTDRYTNIDHVINTPAWVRRKVALSNPYESRPGSKTVFEKETPQDSHTGNLFE
jgi:hypothetical protein